MKRDPALLEQDSNQFYDKVRSLRDGSTSIDDSTNIETVKVGRAKPLTVLAGDRLQGVNIVLSWLVT